MQDSRRTRAPLRLNAYQPLQQKRPRRPFRTRMRVVLETLIVGAATLGLTFGCTSPGDPSSSPQVKGDQWRLSIQGFQEGKARHFNHKLDENTTVTFFLIKLSEGNFRAALDACEVCWPQGKGYVQEGNYMVCKNCGRKFPNENLGLYRGGCNPHPLAYRLEGKDLVIQLRELQEGAKYFRLTGGSRS